MLNITEPCSPKSIKSVKKMLDKISEFEDELKLFKTGEPAYEPDE